MNHFSDLGRIGMGSRLKRLSDYLISEVNAIYKEADIEFEASCFPLLTLIERHEGLSLRDAEQMLGTTHSYVSQKVKYLMQEQLVTMQESERDKRTKLLSLTKKGHALIKKARPYWKSMDKTFAELLYPEERQIFQALKNLEDRILTSSFHDKVMDMHNRPAVGEITMADYKPEYKKAFCDLNLEWLEKYFVLTEFDHQAFDNPEKIFLKKGGDIFFAMIDGEPVGTAALYPVDGGFELCKMGVDPRYRGAGIGRLLIDEAERRAKKLKAKKLELLTNARLLAPAVRLYSAAGFAEVPLTQDDLQKYGRARVDMRMEKSLLKNSR